MLSYLFWRINRTRPNICSSSLATAYSFVNLTEPDQLLFPLTAAFVLGALFAGMMRPFCFGHKQDLVMQLALILALGFTVALYQPYSVHVARNSSEVIAGVSLKPTT